MFLTWSPLTRTVQGGSELRSSVDYGGEFSHERASLNRELKRGPINDCMTDVVVYGGPRGGASRQAAQRGVAARHGGTHRRHGLQASRTARLPAALALRHREPGQQADLRRHPRKSGPTRRNAPTRRMLDRVATSPASTRIDGTWWPTSCRCSTLPARSGRRPVLERLRRNVRRRGGSARDVFDPLSRSRAWTPRRARPSR